MLIALQIALFLAALAFIALAGCLIPLVFETRRRLDRLAVLAEQSRNDLEALVRDSREAIRNVNALTQRANQQMNDVAQVVHTVQTWAERADRWFDEVAATIEPPLFSLARNLTLLRVGATTFLTTLFQHNQDNHQTIRGKAHD